MCIRDRCTKCVEIFPTKESKTLHSCNSLLDKNGISEEGQERATRVSIDHNEENEQNDDIHQLPTVNRKRHSSTGHLSTADSDSKMSEEPLTKKPNTTNANECDSQAETEADEPEMNNEEEVELRLERDDDDNDGGDDLSLIHI